MKWAVGIDPGRKGAMVALSMDDEVLVYRSRLAAGWRSDQERHEAWLELLREVGGSASIGLVWVELQHVRHGQRGQVAHVREAGMWCGWAVSWGLRLEERRASGNDGWRAAAGLGPRAGKQDVLELVERRLPNLDLAPGRLRVPHMGIVDAAGIALGARSHWRRS